MPFTELSAALNTATANSGVRELCMNIGIIMGAMIAHFVEATGTRNVEIAVKKNVINTKTIPVSCRLLTQFVNTDTINLPISVCLKIKQNWAAKNINISNEDRSFK